MVVGEDVLDFFGDNISHSSTSQPENSTRVGGLPHQSPATGTAPTTTSTTNMAIDDWLASSPPRSHKMPATTGNNYTKPVAAASSNFDDDWLFGSLSSSSTEKKKNEGISSTASMSTSTGNSSSTGRTSTPTSGASSSMHHQLRPGGGGNGNLNHNPSSSSASSSSNSSAGLSDDYLYVDSETQSVQLTGGSTSGTSRTTARTSAPSAQQMVSTPTTTSGRQQELQHVHPPSQSSRAAQQLHEDSSSKVDPFYNNLSTTTSSRVSSKEGNSTNQSFSVEDDDVGYDVNIKLEQGDDEHPGTNAHENSSSSGSNNTNSGTKMNNKPSGAPEYFSMVSNDSPPRNQEQGNFGDSQMSPEVNSSSIANTGADDDGAPTSAGGPGAPAASSSTSKPFCYQTFVTEVLKHPSATPTIHNAKLFVDQVNNLAPEKRGAAIASFRAYIPKLHAKLMEAEIYEEADDQSKQYALEGLEKFVATKIYNSVFRIHPEDDGRRDRNVSTKLTSLKWVKLHRHLDVSEAVAEHPKLEVAKDFFTRLNEYKAPRDKLICLQNVCKVLLTCLEQCSNGSSAGADDLLPVLLFVLIQVNPPNLHSNLEFISNFHQQLVEEGLYYLTTVKSALEFLRSMDHTALSNVDKGEFEFNCEDILRPLGLALEPEPGEPGFLDGGNNGGPGGGASSSSTHGSKGRKAGGRNNANRDNTSGATSSSNQEQQGSTPLSFLGAAKSMFNLGGGGGGSSSASNSNKDSKNTGNMAENNTANTTPSGTDHGDISTVDGTLSTNGKTPRSSASSSQNNAGASENYNRSSSGGANYQGRSLSHEEIMQKCRQELEATHLVVPLDDDRRLMLREFEHHFNAHKMDSLTIREVPQLLSDYKALSRFFQILQKTYHEQLKRKKK
ncbi:unnamed protein product [Amoebophrya sp. A120]|nr:unnamed protein product [Amoebophrya sp. A120]|eukprot:GSA120T00018225001.1